MTALRQPSTHERMIDAMVLRGFRPRTQESYLRAVSQMARHYHRSPELITDQEVQAQCLSDSAHRDSVRGHRLHPQKAVSLGLVKKSLARLPIDHDHAETASTISLKRRPRSR